MNYKNTIVELSKKFDTDKRMDNGLKCYNGVLGHNYAIHYDNILKNLNVDTMLEIGVSWGASIKMWDEFFNKKTSIFGIDINEKRFKCKDIETDNVKIYLGDQGDINFLNEFNIYEFDFIVDDGSHRMKHQQISLKTLFKNLRSGGIYVIEDLHTSNYSSFYDSKNETTTIELIKSLKNGVHYSSNYMNDEEYKYLMNNIENIEIHENNTICFIRKK